MGVAFTLIYWIVDGVVQAYRWGKTKTCLRFSEFHIVLPISIRTTFFGQSTLIDCVENAHKSFVSCNPRPQQVQTFWMYCKHMVVLFFLTLLSFYDKSYWSFLRRWSSQQTLQEWLRISLHSYTEVCLNRTRNQFQQFVKECQQACLHYWKQRGFLYSMASTSSTEEVLYTVIHWSLG